MLGSSLLPFAKMPDALDAHASRSAAMPPDEAIVMPVLAALPQAMAIYAFGSRVKGDHRPDSDLDLAILVPGYADPLELWALAGDLSAAIDLDVDLLDLRRATTVMQYQVLTEGRRLWGREPGAGRFECFVMSEKLDFDRARAGLLADIRREGRVYGR